MAKIIVGIDASERSGDAVALAAQLAGANAELVLVSAFPYDTSDVRGASPGYERALRSDALEAIAHAREGIELGDVTERAVPDISPARVLQTIAELEDAALIVIGSSHRGAIGRALVGTTAERLLHGAPCPVAVAPEGSARDRSGRSPSATTGRTRRERRSRARRRWPAPWAHGCAWSRSSTR